MNLHTCVQHWAREEAGTEERGAALFAAELLKGTELGSRDLHALRPLDAKHTVEIVRREVVRLLDRALDWGLTHGGILDSASQMELWLSDVTSSYAMEPASDRDLVLAEIAASAIGQPLTQKLFRTLGFAMRELRTGKATRREVVLGSVDKASGKRYEPAELQVVREVGKKLARLGFVSRTAYNNNLPKTVAVRLAILDHQPSDIEWYMEVENYFVSQWLEFAALGVVANLGRPDFAELSVGTRITTPEGTREVDVLAAASTGERIWLECKTSSVAEWQRQIDKYRRLRNCLGDAKAVLVYTRDLGAQAHEVRQQTQLHNIEFVRLRDLDDYLATAWA